MSRRRWLLVGAFVLCASVVVVAVLVTSGGTRSDCDTVRQMLDFNRTHNAAVSKAGSTDPTETPISDYQQWASQLRAYANEVHDGSLAQHAEHVAAIASQTVVVVGQARDDGSQSPVSGPPPWVRSYAELNRQFEEEVSALSAACPR